jgi:hypothetical protein
MAASSGPDIVDSGLVLALDAADRNSFDSNENLLFYSEQFNDASWGKASTSVSANATVAPDGTLTADNVTNTPNSLSYLAQVKSGLSATTTYTASVYVKPLTTNKVVAFEWGGAWTSFNLSNLTTNGGGGTGQITVLNDGWYRISHTVINVTSFTVIYIGNYGATADTVTVALWGAQLEIGSSASPYYPTTGTAKNRGSTLIDLTGRGNTGTLTNGPTYNSSNGGSLVLDGVDDYTSISNNTLLSFGTNSFTINLWIRRISTSSLTPIITTYNDYNTGFPTYFYAAIYNGTSGYDTGFTLLTSSGNYITSLSAIPITNNEWVNISITRSGNNITLYRNGSLYSTASSSGNDWSGTGRPTLIGGGVAGTTPLNGNISNVSIYNRALTATEVQQNFNATRSRFGI